MAFTLHRFADIFDVVRSSPVYTIESDSWHGTLHSAPCRERVPLGALMNRTLRSKLLYVCALAMLGGIVVTLVTFSPFDKRLVLIVAAVVLFIPGRIQGLVFRDHFRGRRLMDAGQLESGIDHFERFLSQLRKQPWKKQFTWLAWGIYSWDIEAMTLNNLGAALMNIGQFDAASDRLKEALRVDPKYPVPYFNLAVLASAQGDEAQACVQISRAESLGYARTPMDRVIQMGQTVLANMEGQGVSRDRSASNDT